MTDPFSEIKSVIHAGNASALDDTLASALDAHPLDPGVCHLVGIASYWSAMQAEDAGDERKADHHWSVAIPLIVYALEQPDYLEALRAAREHAYGQPISAEEMAAARESFYAWVENGLKKLANVATNVRREDSVMHTQRTLTAWRLERRAARLVGKLGGVPADAARSGRHIACGPAFATMRGIYDLACANIARIPVPEISEMDRLIRLVAKMDAPPNGKVAGDAVGTGLDEDLPDTKRKAGYCFSRLGEAFLFTEDRQFGRALDALSQLAGDDAAAGGVASGGVTSEAAHTRKDARQLALRIRLEVGSEMLFRSLDSMPQALVYWGEAMQDAAILDENVTSFLIERQGVQIARRMLETANSRIDQLSGMDEWDAAQSLAEGLTRIIPSRDSLKLLVGLLNSKAAHCANEQRDFAAAASCLRRCRVLSPNDPSILRGLLITLWNQAGTLAEEEKFAEAIETSLDVIGVAVDLLRLIPGQKDAMTVKSQCSMLIMAFLEKLDPQENERLIAFAVMTLKGMSSDAPEMDPALLEGIRLANRARDRAMAGALVDAFADVDEALRRNPANEQIKQLHEQIAEAAVLQLCDKGELEKAAEICESAWRVNGEDSERIQRCRVRVLMERMGAKALLSENPEDIATLVSQASQSVGKDRGEEVIQRRALRLGALIDPEIQTERKLSRADDMMRMKKWEEALALLKSLTLTGRDSALATHYMIRCHYHLGRPDEALLLADQFVAEHPLIPYAKFIRGQMLSRLGRFEEAEEDMMTYLEVKDTDEECLLELMMNSFRAGDHKDALASAVSARKRGQSVQQPLLVQCMCLLHLGRGGEIAAALADLSPEARNTPLRDMMARWLLGEISDEDLLTYGDEHDKPGGCHFWVGAKAMALGDHARGITLINECLRRGDTRIYEYEHALAMKNAGLLG